MIPLLVLVLSVSLLWLFYKWDTIGPHYRQWKRTTFPNNWKKPPTNPEDDPTFWPPLPRQTHRRDDDPPAMV